MTGIIDFSELSIGCFYLKFVICFIHLRAPLAPRTSPSFHLRHRKSFDDMRSVFKENWGSMWSAGLPARSLGFAMAKADDKI
jgi:hypothetical protein